MLSVQQAIADIVQRAKAMKWGPDLYDMVKEVLPYSDIFNILRRELPEEEYWQFDIEYCEYMRPGQRELNA